MTTFEYKPDGLGYLVEINLEAGTMMPRGGPRRGDVLPPDDEEGLQPPEPVTIDPVELYAAHVFVSKVHGIEDRTSDPWSREDPKTVDEILRGMNVSRAKFDAAVALLALARAEGIPIPTREMATRAIEAARANTQGKQ